ncbi:unnamed protein product [Durusdinium trenchii]|uniref:Uncharacterized protein n=1 Tax=Durusdinium trenchii TaxID=1381693 RepID=A0ABP0IL21_9DINO
MARSWTPVLVASASAGAVGAFFFWRYTRAAKAHLHVEEEPQEPQHEDPEKEEGYVEEPQILEIDFCVEGELQQCEHALGVVQCLRAERGSKQNVELDAAISALDELLPQYAAKLQEKRWLASKASLLDSTSEALQLLLLADDEQNLEAAAKSGRDIPELAEEAAAVEVAVVEVAAEARVEGGCGGGGCGSKSGGGGCGSKSGGVCGGGGCGSKSGGGCGGKKSEGGGGCDEKKGDCGSCSKQGGCNQKAEAPQTKEERRAKTMLPVGDREFKGGRSSSAQAWLVVVAQTRFLCILMHFGHPFCGKEVKEGGFE